MEVPAMRQCGPWPVSVCGWSLRSDVEQVAAVMKSLDIGCIHLAVRPALEKDGKAYLEAVRRQGWTVSAAMIDFPSEDYSTLESIRKTGGVVPDAPWESNRKLALGAIDVTKDLGVKFLSLHLGFIDHAQPALARKLSDRARALADAAAKRGIDLLLETGQESAQDLRRFLETMNHPALKINFDPANMILYDKGAPVEAVRTLAPWIRHVHVKDARRTRTPGTWGEEVPWGDGEVDPDAFLKALKGIGFQGALAIEREAGNDRAGDIAKAAQRLAAHAG
jgi:sugar phosphate isomerase/epimerase